MPKTSRTPKTPKLKRGEFVWAVPIGVSILCLFGYVAWVSYHLELRWYDEVDYLINSFHLAGATNEYVKIRASLVSLLYWPLALICDGDFSHFFHLAGVQAASLACLGIFLFYYAVRQVLIPSLAGLCTLLFACNEILLHHAYLVTIDIPAMLGVLGVLAWLPRFLAAADRKNTVFMAIFLGFSTLARGNLAVLYAYFIGVGVFYFASKQWAKGTAFCLAAIYGYFFEVVVSSLVYAWVFHDLSAGFAGYYQVFFRNLFVTAVQYEIDTPLNRSYFAYLGDTIPFTLWPFIGLAVARMLQSRPPYALLIFGIFAAGIGSLSRLKSSNEPRYLLPFLPCLYVLIGLGMQEAIDMLRAARRPSLRKWHVTLTVALGVLVMFVPLRQAARAVQYFQQPFFFQDFLPRVVSHLRTAAKGRIYWLNKFYTLIPPHPRGNWGVHSDIIHLAAPQLENFLNRRIEILQPQTNMRQLPMTEGLANLLQNQDTLIISHPHYYLLHFHPEVLPPLQILHWKRVDFQRWVHGTGIRFVSPLGNLEQTRGGKTRAQLAGDWTYFWKGKKDLFFRPWRGNENLTQVDQVIGVAFESAIFRPSEGPFAQQTPINIR